MMNEWCWPKGCIMIVERRMVGTRVRMLGWEVFGKGVHDHVWKVFGKGVHANVWKVFGKGVRAIG